MKIYGNNARATNTKELKVLALSPLPVQAPHRRWYKVKAITF